MRCVEVNVGWEVGDGFRHDEMNRKRNGNGLSEKGEAK